MIKLILASLLLAGCVSQKGYVTNDQLHFRFRVYCENQAYASLEDGPPYSAKDIYEECMDNFGYMLPKDLVREDWQWSDYY